MRRAFFVFLAACSSFGRDTPTAKADGGAKEQTPPDPVTGVDATCVTTSRGAIGVALEAPDGHLFCVDATEASSEDYQTFLTDQAGKDPGLDGFCSIDNNPTDSGPDFAATPGASVVGVNYCDAKNYCRWTGKRICEEAELQFACSKKALGETVLASWENVCNANDECQLRRPDCSTLFEDAFVGDAKSAIRCCSAAKQN